MLCPLQMRCNRCKSTLFRYSEVYTYLKKKKQRLTSPFTLIATFRLREINFGDCLLKTRGAVIISEAIQDGHMALETLILEANEIGPNGGCSIASAMGNKELLTTLSLDCNQVSITS